MFRAEINTTIKTNMFEKELCEFYCLGIHKRLISSRHHVHWLASIFDCLLQRKVQNQKLLLLIQVFFFFSSTLSMSALSFALCFINFHSCGGLLEKYYEVNKKLTPNVST